MLCKVKLFGWVVGLHIGSAQGAFSMSVEDDAGVDQNAHKRQTGVAQVVRSVYHVAFKLYSLDNHSNGHSESGSGTNHG